MILPSRLTLYGYAIALDGGTRLLMGSDETGREHTINLVQHAFPRLPHGCDRVCSTVCPPDRDKPAPAAGEDQHAGSQEDDDEPDRRNLGDKPPVAECIYRILESSSGGSSDQSESQLPANAKPSRKEVDDPRPAGGQNGG